MSRIKELEEQITKLQQEKSKIYVAERKVALADILEKIALFEITAKELGIKAVDGRKSKKVTKIASKKTPKKVTKKAARKTSGVYFDLDGKKVSAKKGPVPKEVKAFAAEKGVALLSLKRNADGSPVVK